MSFATTAAVLHLGKLHKSRDETGDFTLTCQGEVIKAHSLILGMGSVLKQMLWCIEYHRISRSEYFMTALSTAVGDNSKTIDVKEFSYEVLSKAVDFMYGIEIPEDFNNRDDLKSLLHMGDIFLMEGLKDAAGFLIAKNLNKENVFDTSQLADKFRAVALSKRCAEFLFDNASTIEDENLEEMKEGHVMASLAKKFMMESKKDQWKESWLNKLFGERPDFKRREEFRSLQEYEGYIKPRIKANMLVRCNVATNLRGHMVTKGHVGIVTETDNSSYVAVKWLTLKAGDPAYHKKTDQDDVYFECLDLLTSPVDFI